ncbi:DUF58 domain-containing protein [Candidatus Gracilibacteria bacterium]|nr:DUF58 domain-containing protein [Candidatus Gracilibacteria bacterium]
MTSKYRNLEITIKKKLSGDFLGSFQSAFKGLGNEFDSLREYIPGDSIKSIDWKSTAKLGDVHVKNYEEEKDLKVLFFINDSVTLNFGSEDKSKKETLEAIFYLLAQSSISTGHSVGAFIGKTFIDFKKSEDNIIRILNSLSENKTNPESVDSKEIKKYNIKNSLIFVLTDSLEIDTDQLKYLGISNEIVVINIFDYFENNLTEDSFESSFSNKIGALLFGKSNKLTLYKNTRTQKIEALKKSLKKLKIEYLKLDNRDNIFIQFYKFFNSYNN